MNYVSPNEDHIVHDVGGHQMNFSMTALGPMLSSGMYVTSSKKIKKILESNEDVIIKELLNDFKTINFKKYEYIDKLKNPGLYYGLIADELFETKFWHYCNTNK